MEQRHPQSLPSCRAAPVLPVPLQCCRLHLWFGCIFHGVLPNQPFIYLEDNPVAELHVVTWAAET